MKWCYNTNLKLEIIILKNLMHILAEWINKKEKKKATSGKSKRGDP